MHLGGGVARRRHNAPINGAFDALLLMDDGIGQMQGGCEIRISRE